MNSPASLIPLVSDLHAVVYLIAKSLCSTAAGGLVSMLYCSTVASRCMFAAEAAATRKAVLKRFRAHLQDQRRGQWLPKCKTPPGDRRGHTIPICGLRS